MTRRKTCELCGAALAAGPRGGRPARYCSNACRQRAFRQRSMHKVPGRERLASPDASPPDSGRGLPQALDSFVGRRQELTLLRSLLRTSRLLTLTGAGGVGKTRLALEFAKGLPERHARVDLIDLESLHDDAPLAQSVATALGVGERAGRSGTDALIRAIGTTSRLVILDNCEHLAEPCAHLAATLLSHCPRLQILATSREALRVPGETVFRVGELSLPPTSTGNDPAALLRSDAVRLFVERAAHRAPGFTLSHGNAATVAEICRRLDGLTLGIELAARRVGTLPLEDILAGLDARLFQLPLLTDGSRTGPRRHNGLTAAIDWSYRLLEPTEQAVFRRLAVLVGGFDIRAAEAVCAGGGVAPRHILGILCALEAKSLIVRMPGNTHPARFRQLNVIRACAMEGLIASGELDGVRRQSLDWLNSLAERSGGEVFADQAGGLLAGERDNLAAALAGAEGSDAPSRDRLTLELARVYYQHEQPSAARSLLVGLLQRPAGPALGGAVAALATRVACQQTDLDEALRLGEQAVGQEGLRDHPAGLANALDARAAARLCRGEFAAAVADLSECLRIVAALGRREDTAWCTHHLAWALLQAGEEAEADQLMARCLPVLRAQGQWSRVAAALHTAGAVRLSLGHLDNAEELFGEVLRIVPEASFHALYPVEGLALVAAESGDLRRALRLYEASAQARRQLDTEPEDPWRRRVELTAARARAGLSTAAQHAVVSGGRRLRGDRLVAYALRSGSGYSRSASDATAVVVDQFPLTGREFRVAELVAEGLTNRQIAAQLGLSEHTVATHLDKIRDKLGVRSRTRIALWAAARARDDF
ncbi:LuxR C-terminal-related transcriptional regulator [Streptomyces sp. NPDC006446]|uniref:ATP-binding protein n=1 Tax=Streptomyces sp. NPDC006446 TaxID=3154301 RepID=UPI0033AF9902